MGLSGISLILVFLLTRHKIELFFFNEFQYQSYMQTTAISNNIFAKKYQLAKPFRNHDIGELEIQARAALSVQIKEDGSQKVLFEKNKANRLPIASLTKLITACVVSENYNLSEEVSFSKKATLKEGDHNFFRQGEIFYAEDLLYSSLMESSNKAVYALTEVMGEDQFVKAMNNKAQELILQDTKFFNPTGLDPDNEEAALNYSTAEDLVKVAKYLLEDSLIREISVTKQKDLYQTSGYFHHTIYNTNELLGQIPDILIAKTGYTHSARECLLIAFENPKDDSVLINVILGSENNFGEMKKMIDWILKAYKWYQV